MYGEGVCVCVGGGGVESLGVPGVHVKFTRPAAALPPGPL